MERAAEPNTPKIVKFDALAERINMMFDQIARRAYGIFEGNGRQFGHDLEDWFRAERELLQPITVNVAETTQGIEVEADVTGFNEKELEISVEPRRLTITGKHEAIKEEKKGTEIDSKRQASEIMRVVYLPAEVQAEKATATIKNGVLTVGVPKAAKEQ
jgi:HSP20 family protein